MNAKHTIISPDKVAIAEVEVETRVEPATQKQFYYVRIKPLRLDEDQNCLARTMAWQQTPPEELPLTEWSQVVAINPATTGICWTLLDSDAISTGSGHTTFEHYVRMLVKALDSLWD